MLINRRNGFPPAFLPLWDTIYVNACVQYTDVSKAYDLACQACSRLVDEDLAQQRENALPPQNPSPAYVPPPAQDDRPPAWAADLLNDMRERKAQELAKANQPKRSKANGTPKAEG